MSEKKQLIENFVENRIKFCYNIFCMFASKCKECIIKIVKTQIDKTEHMF